MFFASLSKREKLIFSITFAVVSASVIYAFVIEPAVKMWFQQEEQILEKEARLKKGFKIMLKDSKTKEDFKKYAGRLLKASSDEQEMAGLLSEIETLTRKAGVDVNALRPRVIQGMDLYQRFVVELELDATVPQIVNFLYDIQNSDKLLKVIRLEINAKVGQDAVRAYMQVSRIVLTE